MRQEPPAGISIERIARTWRVPAAERAIGAEAKRRADPTRLGSPPRGARRRRGRSAARPATVKMSVCRYRNCRDADGQALTLGRSLPAGPAHAAAAASGSSLVSGTDCDDRSA